MNKLLLCTSISVLAALILLTIGCGGGVGTSATQRIVTPSTDAGAVSATGRYADLVYTVTAPRKVYTVGEEIILAFTIQNTGTTDAYSDFSYKPGVVDAEIEKPDGTVAIPTTYYHAGTGGGLFSGRVVYEAGKTLAYPLSFGTATGYTPPGHYRIRAFAGSNLNGSDVPDLSLGTDFIDIEVR